MNWDRRGAGKSFDARLQTPAFTVRQTLNDTFELTRLLRDRFHQPRIYLVGHSWGAYLGLLAIREHPENYDIPPRHLLSRERSSLRSRAGRG